MATIGRIIIRRGGTHENAPAGRRCSPYRPCSTCPLQPSSSRSARATAWSSPRTSWRLWPAHGSSVRAGPPSTRQSPRPSSWRSPIPPPGTSAAAASSSSARFRATRGVRLPRDGSRQGHTDHVPEGREVQQRAAPRQLPVGWRAGYRRRTAPRVEGTRHAAVEAARRAGGRAGARRFPRDRGTGALARVGAQVDGALPRVHRTVLQGRHAVRGRRPPQAARPGPNAPANRRPGPGRASTPAKPPN